jgi:hypothetical protein
MHFGVPNATIFCSYDEVVLAKRGKKVELCPRTTYGSVMLKATPMGLLAAAEPSTPGWVMYPQGMVCPRCNEDLVDGLDEATCA